VNCLLVGELFSVCSAGLGFGSSPLRALELFGSSSEALVVVVNFLWKFSRSFSVNC
jgi:hypothetical protein